MKNVRRKWKKFSALALAIVLVGTSTNVTAFAAEGCEHHTHNETCGYVEAVEGADCTHEHDDECYSEVVGCVHEHDENCGYVQAVEGSPCTYACEECAAEVSNEEEEEAVTCTCGTDDPAIHAINCPAYVAPENPVCICAMKCSEDTLNVWCDICGVQGVSVCQGEDTAVAYDENVTSRNCGATVNDNVTWNFDSATGTLTISGTGAMKDMSYEDEGEDQPWLDYRTTITKIVIGFGITQIGKLAFYNCVNVEEVVFERDGNGNSSVTTIGNHAFRQLENALTEIVIPASVEEIGNNSFHNCTQLQNIIFEEGSNLTTIGEQAFRNVMSVEEYIIPSNVNTIANEAFMGNKDLKRFYYPSRASFGESVFYTSNKLEYFGKYTINETDKTCSVSYIGLNTTTCLPDATIVPTVSEIIIPETIDGYEVVGVTIGDTTISVPSDFEAEHTVERLSDITSLDGWTYEAETDTLSPGSSKDVTAIYSVSGTPKLIKEITISRSACTDANNDYVCDECGRTIGSADDGSDDNNNTPEETKETEEQIFTRELLTKVAGAKAGDNVVIDATIWHSFSAKVLEQLFAKEGVSYTIYYHFEGEYFYITIPANAALEEGCDWYGPLKLNAMFGRTMITKAEYEEAIAKIRKTNK